MTGKRVGQKTLGVIFCGGCGSNIADKIVQRWKNLKYPNLRLLVINTDHPLLDKYFPEKEEDDTSTRYQGVKEWAASQQLIILKIGKSGMGAGCKKEVAKRDAEEKRAEIEEFLSPKDGAPLDCVLVVAGLGKGTGTGVAPYVAQLSKDAGIDTHAVVTMPFDRLEAEVTKQIAKEAMDTLLQITPTTVVQNSKLANLNVPWSKAFDEIDDSCLLPLLEELINVNMNVNFQMNIDQSDHRTAHEAGNYVIVSFATWEEEQTIEDVIAALKEAHFQDEKIWLTARVILAHFYGGNNEGDDRRWLVGESIQVVDAFTQTLSSEGRKNLRTIPGISESPGPKRVALKGVAPLKPEDASMIIGGELSPQATTGLSLVPAMEAQDAPILAPAKPFGDRTLLHVTQTIAEQWKKSQSSDYPAEQREELYRRIEKLTGRELFRTAEHETLAIRSKGV